MKTLLLILVAFAATIARAGTDYSKPAALDNIHFSPDNVYDASRSTPIVIDFGADVDFNAVVANVKITKTGYPGYVVNGTAHYGYTPVGAWSQVNTHTFEFDMTYVQQPGMLIVITVPAGQYGANAVPTTQHGAFMTVPSTTPVATTALKVNTSGDPNNELFVQGIYRSAENNKVLFWVHGGGWQSGLSTVSGTVMTSTGEQVSAVFGQFLAKYYPITVISLPYREPSAGPTGIFDNALADLRTAVNYVQANPAFFHAVDVSQSANQAFAGGSAGTPLSALLAIERRAGIYVGFNGIYDLYDANNQWPVGYPSGNFPDQSNTTTMREKFQAGAKQSTLSYNHSPLYQVATWAPSILLMHGNADTTINYGQSQQFYDAVSSSKTLAILPNAPHAVYRQSKGIPAVCCWELVQFLQAQGFF